MVNDYRSDDDSCVLERDPLERLALEDELRVFKHEGFRQCMDVPEDRELLASPESPPAAVSRSLREGAPR